MTKGGNWGAFLVIVLSAARIHDDAPGDSIRNPWLRNPDGGKVIIHNMDTARSLIRRDMAGTDTTKSDTTRTDTAKPPNRQGLFHWRGKVKGEMDRMLEVRDNRGKDSPAGLRCSSRARDCATRMSLGDLLRLMSS